MKYDHKLEYWTDKKQRLDQCQLERIFIKALPKSWRSSMRLVRPSVRLSIRCCGHSNLVIFNQISSKFHTWIASIKLWFKFEYGFFLTNHTQDGQQNGHRLSVYIHSLL